ncbi:hypothetical protein JW905_17720 [bacterium]|nr:hypothetical protein [candidate division CSSED10-310 bacterium]
MVKITVNLKDMHTQARKMVDDARQTGMKTVEYWFANSQKMLDRLVKMGEEFVDSSPVFQNQTMNRAFMELEQAVKKVREEVGKNVSRAHEATAPLIKPITDHMPRQLKDILAQLHDLWPAVEEKVAAPEKKDVKKAARKPVVKKVSEPFEGYDELNVHKIVDRMRDLPDDKLDEVVAYEDQNKKRLTIGREAERIKKMRA